MTRGLKVSHPLIANMVLLVNITLLSEDNMGYFR